MTRATIFFLVMAIVVIVFLFTLRRGAVVSGRYMQDSVARHDDYTPRRIPETSPARALLDIYGAALPHRYATALRRLRLGPAVTKVDFVLSDDIPWTDSRLAGAATFHLGGTRAVMAHAEAQVAAGRHAPWPMDRLPRRCRARSARQRRHAGRLPRTCRSSDRNRSPHGHRRHRAARHGNRHR